MNSDKVYNSIQHNLSELFQCAQLPGHDVRVRTPLLYPDGGLVDVFVYEQTGQLIVTDYGEALGWLSLQSTSNIQSLKRTNLINDICMTLGIKIENGQLQFVCSNIAELGEAVHRLAQAIVRVSDICFTFPQPAEGSQQTILSHPDNIKAKVTKWLNARSIDYKEEVKHTGRSGIDWTIDYEILESSSNLLMFCLNSNTRQDAEDLRHHVFAGCFDLRNNRTLPFLDANDAPLITLFDDTIDIWKSEDYKLMQSVSEPITLSNINKLERVLTAA